MRLREQKRKTPSQRITSVFKKHPKPAKIRNEDISPTKHTFIYFQICFVHASGALLCLVGELVIYSARRQHVLIRKDFPEQPHRMSIYEIRKKSDYPSAVNVRKFHGAIGNLPEQRRWRQMVREGRSVHPPTQPQIYLHQQPMFAKQPRSRMYL